jgi:hypothetical protein
VNRTTVLGAIPVAAVAVIAGIVSFSHIEGLALRCHQTITDARLLPFAVDGLIVAGVVVVLAGYWLGWLSISLGVAATVFANVESGLPYGPLSAIVSAWPAVAFTVASFVLERWLKSQVVPAAPMAHLNGSGVHPAEAGPFADQLAQGEVPSIRRIRSELHVGQPKAQEIQARLSALVQ